MVMRERLRAQKLGADGRKWSYLAALTRQLSNCKRVLLIGHSRTANQPREYHSIRLEASSLWSSPSRGVPEHSTSALRLT